MAVNSEEANLTSVNAGMDAITALMPYNEAKENQANTFCDALKEITRLGSVIGLNLFIGTAGFYANTVMLAHIDKEGHNLAASNLINAYQNFVIASSNAMLFSIGSAVGTARGAKEFHKIVPLYRNGLLLGFLLTGTSMTLVLVSGLVLKLLGQEQNLCDISQSYFEAYSWGIPALFILTAQQQIALGLGQNLPVNIIAAINTGLTTGLGYILIFGKLTKPLNAAGLGHATSLSYWLNMLGFTVFLKWSSRFKDFALVSLRGKWFNKNLFRELRKLGLPIGFQIGMEFTGVIITTAIIGSLMSPNALKSNEIALQYLFASTVPIYGLGQACSILTGIARGNTNLNFARKLAYASVSLGFAVTSLALCLYSFIPKTLMSPFIDVDDPNNADIVDATRYLLILNGANQLCDTVRIVFAGAIQGTFEDTVYAMKSGFVTMCALAIPGGYLLAIPAKLKVLGFYVARGIGMFLGGSAVFRNWYQRMTSQTASNPEALGYAPLGDLPNNLASGSAASIPKDTGVTDDVVIPIVVSFSSSKEEQNRDEPILPMYKAHSKKGLLGSEKKQENRTQRGHAGSSDNFLAKTNRCRCVLM